MTLALLAANLSFAVFLCLIVLTKEISKSLALFFVVITTIFYGPVVYYSFLGGFSYRYFGHRAYEEYLLLSTYVFGLSSAFVLTKLILPWRLRVELRESPSAERVALFYILAVSACVVAYVLAYLPQFPLVHLVRSGQLIDRPDTTGDIPHFYTMSTFMCFVVPGYYFYLKERLRSRLLKLALFLLAALLTILDGGKGVVVYFFLFVWIFQEKWRINGKLLLMVLASFVIYMAAKGRLTVTDDTMDYLLSSPLRRFFVTQGACFINRIEMLESRFVMDLNAIKIDVYHFMYGWEEEAGSAPTYFMGDLLVRWGVPFSLIANFLVTGLMFFFGSVADAFKRDRIFVRWNLTVIALLIGNAQIDVDSAMRVLAMLLNVLCVLGLRVKTIRWTRELAIEGVQR